MTKPNKETVVITSPGRINLIGEHIDYNGGLVLPAAIDRTIRLGLAKNDTHLCRVKSLTFKEEFVINLQDVKPSDREWHNYILGVIDQIQRIAPDFVKGFDCEIESNLPAGSGISSSAALECGIAKGLNLLFNIGLSDGQLILLSQKAEHSFVGTQCGVMDQFAVVKGKAGHFIMLNCQDLSHEYIPARLEPYTLLLLNSNVSHNLASSEYNTRRKECETALNIINENTPGYKELADVSVEDLSKSADQLPGKCYQRALYVLEEKQRVLQVAEALRSDNLPLVGECLYQSHKGLKELYEVSCEELDYLVDLSRDFNEVLGSRMMGGGFGGCTIQLVRQDIEEEYIDFCSKRYQEKYKIRPTPIQVKLGDGVRQIQDAE